MINYRLKCDQGHNFDSWFQSASAFEKLAAAEMVTCSHCGSTKVEKAIMAPRVRTGRKAVSGIGEPDVANVSQGSGPQPSEGSAPTHVAGPGALSTPATEGAAKMEQALKELRRQVEANSDYVGKDFASEARAMYLGEAPERAIYGEAKADEAKALIEDGIPVLPLPFGRNRKTN